MRCIQSDIQSYYFKGLQTLIQALHEINQQKFAWSIVKLYYSTFYLLRCDILLSNHILVKCQTLYYCKPIKDIKFSKFTGKTRGDHQNTIVFAEKLYKESELNDPIFGNYIDDQNPYLWLLQQRERVNYRLKDFSDPMHDEVFDHTITYFKENDLFNLFLFYQNDKEYTSCFDTDHSILAIPLKKLFQISSKIKKRMPNSEIDIKKVANCSRMLKDLNIGKQEILSLLNNIP